MAQVTRSTGFGQYTTGTLRSVAQLKAFVITVKDTSSAVDLQSLDDGADEMMEAIIREVQPLMYYAPSSSAGTIHVVVDGHAVDATSLQLRIRKLVASVGGDSTYGTESTNVSTVVLGTAIAVS
jgi:hypothetical protein